MQGVGDSMEISFNYKGEYILNCDSIDDLSRLGDDDILEFYLTD